MTGGGPGSRPSAGGGAPRGGRAAGRASGGEPRLARTVEACRREVGRLRGERGDVALVPTMGALHEGHLSLVDRARQLADAVVVSVFVNPTQFGPDEDYEAYPRDLEADRRKAGGRGADLVFAPPPSEMYPREQTVWVEPGPLADRLCGLDRPGHFRGVLTVVLKLFHVVGPDVAVFGRKDFQQSVLIRRMVEELNLPVEIATAPVVRDPDGLAVSSRNAYLSEDEREAARSLSRGLGRAREAFASGEREPARLEAVARRTMEEAGAEVEYVELVEPEGLERIERAGPETVCAVAARVGETRLIDNAALGDG